MAIEGPIRSTPASAAEYPIPGAINPVARNKAIPSTETDDGRSTSNAAAVTVQPIPNVTTTAAGSGVFAKPRLPATKAPAKHADETIAKSVAGTCPFNGRAQNRSGPRGEGRRQ